MIGTFNEAFNNIDTALEVSEATISIISENIENEKLSWALSGVFDQIDKIRSSMEKIDEIFKEKVVSV